MKKNTGAKVWGFWAEYKYWGDFFPRLLRHRG